VYKKLTIESNRIFFIYIFYWIWSANDVFFFYFYLLLRASVWTFDHVNKIEIQRGVDYKAIVSAEMDFFSVVTFSGKNDSAISVFYDSNLSYNDYHDAWKYSYVSIDYFYDVKAIETYDVVLGFGAVMSCRVCV